MSEDHDAGMIVFSTCLAKKLGQDRFPTTYLGVRRLRPSNRVVANVAAGKVHRITTSDIVFKVVDEETGAERRMTAKEKREYKHQLRLAEKKRKQETIETEKTTDNSNDLCEQVLVNSSEVPSKQDEQQNDRESHTPKEYLQLNIDPARLAHEISDLKGEREGVPPVFLPPPIARLLSPEKHLTVKLDDERAQKWAATLKCAFQPAEDTRRKEALRPMPYHLVPEVWSRLRPAVIGTPTETQTTSYDKGDKTSQATMRQTPLDTNVAAVLQLLHVGTGLHLSCGAKFGCDYLIYDGPRSQRHAFAGLRIVPLHDPYPSAYDLSGYVRTLNTAGKLALLACVEQENETFRVAIIDLALVKIAETTFRKPRKTMEQRLKNLAKG